MRVVHRSQARREAGDRRPEAGETLIELLATVVLMSIGIGSLLLGIFTLIRSSDQVNRQSAANLGVHGYAELLKDGAVTYQPCAQPTGGNSYPPFTAIGSAFTARVVSIEYWDGTINGSTRSPNFISGACTAATDRGLQRITLEVSTIDTERRAQERIVLTKRDQRCLVAYQGADGKPC